MPICGGKFQLLLLRPDYHPTLPAASVIHPTYHLHEAKQFSTEFTKTFAARVKKTRKKCDIQVPCQDPVSYTEDTVQYDVMTSLNNQKQTCTSLTLTLAYSTPRVSIGPLVLYKVTHETGKLSQATVADAPKPSYQKDNRNLGSNPTTCK